MNEPLPSYELPFPVPADGSVSVIVRSMDRPTLAQALASLAEQTLPAAEVLIVNARGGEHRAIDAALASRLATGWVSDPQGLALTRPRAAQLGLQAARGDFVLFLDDDDVLLPDHLARLVGALQAAPAAPAAFTDAERGRFEGSRWVADHRFDDGFDPLRLHFENYLPIHAVLFRRRCVEAGVAFDERLPVFEDWDFWLQLADLGAFVHVPGVSARYVAGSVDHSEVFAASPVVRQARVTLFDKWARRLPAERYGELMLRLQQAFRSERQALDQLDSAHEELAGVQAILAQRGEEIGALKHEVRARDEQAQSAREHAQSLLEHTKNLTDMLAARETELGHAMQHGANLEGIVAARDEEVAALRRDLTTLLDETPWRALRRTLRRRRPQTP